MLRFTDAIFLVVVVFLIIVLQHHLSTVSFQWVSGLLEGMIPIKPTKYLFGNFQTSHNVYFGSTRISNELGAGNPEVARLAVFAGIFLWFLEATICSTLLFTCKNIFGYAFSNSKEVVDYVTELSSLLCLSFMVDGFSSVLDGIKIKPFN